MVSVLRLLPILLGAVFAIFVGCVGVSSPARADDDTVTADDGDPDTDIELGEIGSEDEDIAIPSGRRRGGAARQPPPKMVASPSMRLAVAHRFAPDLSAELYGRGQLGAVTDPWTSRSSLAAGGLIVNKSFGALVWSNSLEASQRYRDFYDRETYSGYEFTTAFARVFKFDSLPFSVTPRIGVSYLWASIARNQRWKTELSAPLTHKLTKQLDLVLTPKLEIENFDSRPDNRRDITGYLGIGFKYELAKGASLGAAIGYESRASNVAQGAFTRWKLSPQISFRKDL